MRSKLKGKADAEAASIYAAAFSPPDAQELYSFLRSLDVMRAAFEKRHHRSHLDQQRSGPDAQVDG